MQLRMRCFRRRNARCLCFTLMILGLTSLLYIALSIVHNVYKHEKSKKWKPQLDHELLQNSPIAGNKSLRNVKIIYGATYYVIPWKSKFSFRSCRYSNCIIQGSLNFEYINKADVVLFEHKPDMVYPTVNWTVRQHQYWVLMARESPKILYDSWSSRVNGVFNVTMTYRRDSTIYDPYGTIIKQPSAFQNPSNKTKGAYTYISNCYANYDRIQTVNYLKKYIDIDLFGNCVGVQPCSRMDYTCEAKLHSQYRFYLSFENSLCKDYITEKFWVRLGSKSLLVPVVIGGLSLDDYERVAPPDSFIHAYNFTSLDELGKHLRYLVKNTTAYNMYHVWREKYRVKTGSVANNGAACKICELANRHRKMPVKYGLDSWFNFEKSCTFYPMFPAKTYSIVEEIRNLWKYVKP